MPSIICRNLLWQLKAQLIIAVVWFFHPSFSAFLSIFLSLGDQLKRFYVVFQILCIYFCCVFMNLITISAPQSTTWSNNKNNEVNVNNAEAKQIELKTQFQFEINFSTELFSGRASDTSIKVPSPKTQAQWGRGSGAT